MPRIAWRSRRCAGGSATFPAGDTSWTLSAFSRRLRPWAKARSRRVRRAFFPTAATRPSRCSSGIAWAWSPARWARSFTITTSGARSWRTSTAMRSGCRPWAQRRSSSLRFRSAPAVQSTASSCPTPSGRICSIRSARSSTCARATSCVLRSSRVLAAPSRDPRTSSACWSGRKPASASTSATSCLRAPTQLAAGRIQHVQLNDLDADLAKQVREHGHDYSEAVSLGLFTPLGEGSARVDRVVEALRGSKYRGWYALRQETRLASSDDRPLGRVSRSLEYLMPLLS